MAKMRTIRQTVKEMKEKDPNTAVVESRLRRWVKEGKVKHVISGNTILVNLESLEAFLSGEQ